MTNLDSCAYFVDVSCGVPKITFDVATGAFDSSEGKVEVHYLEGLGSKSELMAKDGDYVDTDGIMMNEMPSAGQFFPLMKFVNSQGLKKDPLLNAKQYASSKKSYQYIPVDF